MTGEGPRRGRALARIGAVVCALALVVVAGACGEDGWSPFGESAREETISREAFVSTYVDLRLVALRSPDRTIDPSERDRVLRRHGVSREDLLRFVDVHADRVDYMREIWSEVDRRLERARSDPGDTSSS